MKRAFKYIFIAIVALLSSCEFDHLYYETNLLALVQIDVDWSKSHISPNGVSAYIYDSNGDFYKKELSNNPNVVYLKLPAGNYSVVLYNNSISEISGVDLKDMDRLESSSIYATERKREPLFSVSGSKPIFVNEPDDVVSCTLRDIKVSKSDLKYHYYKPDLADYEQEVNYRYDATPLHIVHLTRVIVHIGGLQYAAGAPTAILRGMSSGYNFGLEHTADESAMEEFLVNTRVTKTDGDDSSDTIYIDYNTFGMHTVGIENRIYYLDIRFTLIDGSYKDYSFDVSDNIRTETTKTQNRHIIELELEPLPEVEGGGNEGGNENDEVFDPSIDDWVDVDVSLPM